MYSADFALSTVIISGQPELSRSVQHCHFESVPIKAVVCKGCRSFAEPGFVKCAEDNIYFSSQWVIRSCLHNWLDANPRAPGKA